MDLLLLLAQRQGEVHAKEQVLVFRRTKVAQQEATIASRSSFTSEDFKSKCQKHQTALM